MKSPLKYFGGKYYLAKDIVKLFPPTKYTNSNGYLHYVEPYAGSLAVLFENSNFIGTSEVINDIWGSLTVFWRILQNKELFNKFASRVGLINFCEENWLNACNILDSKFLHGPLGSVNCLDPVEEAIAFFVCNRQSRGGEFRDFATLSKNRVRGGMNEQVSAWLSCVERLPEVHERLKRVVVLNHDAYDVIKEEDSYNTFFYLDPTYLPDDRTSTGQYLYEMTVDQHKQLLFRLKRIKGKFLLSSYPNELYDSYSFNYTDFNVNKPSSGNGGRGVERIYRNY